MNESPRKESKWERLAPLTGVGFFVVAFVSVWIAGESPDFLAEPQEFADYYVDNADQLLVSMNLALISLVLLVWFLGSLRRTLLRAEGGDGRLSAIAYGGGLVATSLYSASFALNALGGLRAGEDDAIAPDIAALLSDGSSILLGLAAPIALAALLFATAIVTIRRRALPVWLGWVSVVLGVIGLIGPISWMLGFFLFPLWVLATSIVLYVRERHPVTAEPVAATATTTTVR